MEEFYLPDIPGVPFVVDLTSMRRHCLIAKKSIFIPEIVLVLHRQRRPVLEFGRRYGT